MSGRADGDASGEIQKVLPVHIPSTIASAVAALSTKKIVAAYRTATMNFASVPPERAWRSARATQLRAGSFLLLMSLASLLHRSNKELS